MTCPASLYLLLLDGEDVRLEASAHVFGLSLQAFQLVEGLLLVAQLLQLLLGILQPAFEQPLQSLPILCRGAPQLHDPLHSIQTTDIQSEARPCNAWLDATVK